MSKNTIRVGSRKSNSRLSPGLYRPISLGWLASHSLRAYAGPMFRDSDGQWWIWSEALPLSRAERRKQDELYRSLYQSTRNSYSDQYGRWSNQLAMQTSQTRDPAQFMYSQTTLAVPPSAPPKQPGAKRSKGRASKASGSTISGTRGQRGTR